MRTIAPDRIYHYQHVTDSIAELLSALTSWPLVTLEWYGYRNLEHHMTIVSRDDKANTWGGEWFLGGVYFRRPGKSTSISPLFLSQQEDLKALAEYCDRRAKLARDASTETWKRGVGRIFRAVKKDRTLVVTITREAPQVFETLYGALRQKLVFEIKTGQIRIR